MKWKDICPLNILEYYFLSSIISGKKPDGFRRSQEATSSFHPYPPTYDKKEDDSSRHPRHLYNGEDYQQQNPSGFKYNKPEYPFSRLVKGAGTIFQDIVKDHIPALIKPFLSNYFNLFEYECRCIRVVILFFSFTLSIMWSIIFLTPFYFFPLSAIFSLINIFTSSYNKRRYPTKTSLPIHSLPLSLLWRQYHVTPV